MNYPPLSPEEEQIGKQIVNAAFKIHQELGPGLLEKVYEVCLAHELKTAGLQVKRQAYIPIHYDGLIFEEGLRLDILVNDLIIIELKAAESLHPIWQAQLLSHLRLMNLNLGYLINFNTVRIKNGIHRFRN